MHLVGSLTSVSNVVAQKSQIKYVSLTLMANWQWTQAYGTSYTGSCLLFRILNVKTISVFKVTSMCLTSPRVFILNNVLSVDQYFVFKISDYSIEYIMFCLFVLKHDLSDFKQSLVHYV